MAVTMAWCPAAGKTAGFAALLVCCVVYYMDGKEMHVLLWWAEFLDCEMDVHDSRKPQN